MNREDLINMIIEVGKVEDSVSRNALLTDISDEVGKLYDNADSLNTTIESLNTNLTKSNEDLKKAQEENLKLFLRVGEQKNSQEVNKVDTGINKEPEKRKFEDLFKEGKGDGK